MDTYPWLAGLLEGEGTFLKGSPSAPGKPRVVVTMTDRDVVQRVADLLGVKSIHEYRRSSPKWKVGYTVQVSGQRAVDLMRRVRPLMGERRQVQIDAAIACWNPQGARYKRRNAKIIRLHLAGQSTAVIGRALGMSQNAVRHVIVRSGILESA